MSFTPFRVAPSIARAEGGKVSYVKAHGALYNRAARDPVQAAALASAIRAYDVALPLLTLPGSAAATAGASAGLTVVADMELFPWLGSFGTQLTLCPRRSVHPGRQYFATGHALLDVVVSVLHRHRAGAAP